MVKQELVKAVRLVSFSLLVICMINGCAHTSADYQTESEQFKANPFHFIAENASIPELNQKLKNGEISTQQLAQYFLRQIELKNQQLNALITINPKAMEIAQQLDAEIQQGKMRGLLHGIPIVIKDNIDTASMATTAGSLALKDNMTERDATLVAKLKQAGAIIIGKANLSEWANFRSERSSSGWSAMGGQTRNPHDLSRSPCGSSSGSGAAVAGYLAVAAIGTETNGSITCPSSANGLVGIKPTVGLVSRYGIVPISHTQDTAGPMTKSVIDAAIILTVIQGEDPKDPATQKLSKAFTKDLIPAMTPIKLNGKRIGIVDSPALNHEGVREVFDKAKQALEATGVNLIRDLKTEPYDKFYDDSYQVLLYEFKHDLNQYFAGLNNQLKGMTLAQLIEFNEQHAAQEMPYFQQEIFKKSQSKGPLSDPQYSKALNDIRQATRQNGIDKLIQEHQLDAIISVTLAAAWSIDEINGDNYVGGFSSYPAIAGYPHITLPMGKVHHMPVGLSITAAKLSEKELIEIAYAIEKLLQNASSPSQLNQPEIKVSPQ